MIRQYPEAFERLIGRVRILQRWLKASDEEVAQALVSDPRPVWAEPLDPILHFLINAGSK